MTNINNVRTGKELPNENLLFTFLRNWKTLLIMKALYRPVYEVKFTLKKKMKNFFNFRTAITQEKLCESSKNVVIVLSVTSLMYRREY